MSRRLKNHKLDPNFVSMQKHEIQYIASKFGIQPDIVRTLVKELGRSRQKMYRYLRQYGGRTGAVSIRQPKKKIKILQMHEVCA